MAKAVIWILTTALLATTVESLTKCLPDDEQFALKYDIIETLSEAPIVVIAQDMWHDTEANTVHLQVKCILKSEIEIPANITLKDADQPDECSKTSFNEGEEYVVCVKKDVDESLSSDIFSVFEPGEFNPGAWEVNAEVQNKAVNLCGVAPKEVAEGANMCPRRTATADNCISIDDINAGNVLRAHMLISLVILLLLHCVFALV